MQVRVNNVDNEMTFILNETAQYYHPDIEQYIKEQQKNGWSFFVVAQQCGRCYYGPKFITIPNWAIKRGINYATWYISHELAHSYAGKKAKHGPEFMKQLIRICPNDFQHFEYSYKPENAQAAGVAIPRNMLF